MESIKTKLNAICAATDSDYIAGDGRVYPRVSYLGKTWHRIAHICTCGKHPLPPKMDIPAARGTVDTWLNSIKTDTQLPEREFKTLVIGVVKTFNAFLLHEKSSVARLEKSKYLVAHNLSLRPVADPNLKKKS